MINTSKMPKFSVNRTVSAVRIQEVVRRARPGGQVIEIVPEDGKPFEVNKEAIRGRNVTAGGYLLVDEDGQASYMAAKSFEETYEAVEASAPVTGVDDLPFTE